MITQAQLLEITQDAHDIKVKREGDFALTCEFYPGQFHTEETPLGSEVCGWNAHQLVFRLLLPEGLAIQHVFSVITSYSIHYTKLYEGRTGWG